MNDMWTALERYQPYADKHGFGDAWRRMTEERTEEAAHAAYDAATDAADAAYASGTAWAAGSAWAGVAWAAARRRAEAEAIARINEAIKLEEKL